MPVFLFVVDRCGTSLRQLDLALQWKGSTDAAPWKILRMDKVSGKAVALAEGVGMSGYVRTLGELEKSGIRQSDILWGGPPTQSERERLLGTRAETGSNP
jgi:hypothetical protein